MASPRRAAPHQVVATSLVAEHIGPLIEMFTARDEGLEIAVEAVPGAAFADLLSTGAPTSRSAPPRSRARPRSPRPRSCAAG